MMKAGNFEDLAQQCVMSATQYRMLYVFVRVGAVDMPGAPGGEETLAVQVLFDAHQPAQHGMTFDAIRQSADAHNPQWNMVVVGLARNGDNSLPDDTQAQGVLAEMRDQIMMGVPDGCAVFDRDGNAVDAEAEIVPLNG
ncbi:MAG: hypothetical protein HQL36_03225 [Alphaproteobacteria bacterium]|nr:hypothetical protein [Alphaproteobacteria bacterium]MBF0250155.1 hypothetical protein [Alphaproteobacteria bacterium]